MARLERPSKSEVQCTTGVPYSVGLNAGVNPLTLARRMKHSTNASFAAYEIYTDTGRLIPWGNIAPATLVNGTGTGAPQTHTVFGRVPVQPVPEVGTYTDTITVTVTY